MLKIQRHLTFKVVLLLVFSLSMSSCAYRLGYGYRELPKNIKSLHVPMFSNSTMDVGPEVDFTNELVRELKRSKVAKLTSKSEAEGRLEGRVVSIVRIQRAQEAQSRDANKVKTSGMVNLPKGTFVATEYLLRVKIEMQLRNNKTNQVVWKQWFADESIYSAARLALKGINTGAPNYTSSEEQRVIKLLAEVMMKEAVGRLTENF